MEQFVWNHLTGPDDVKLLRRCVVRLGDKIGKIGGQIGKIGVVSNMTGAWGAA